MPEAIAYSMRPNCDYACNNTAGYYDRRTTFQQNDGMRSCTFCGAVLCETGQYPAGLNCSECCNCTPAYEYRGGGWQFISNGVVDQNMSCISECASGMYRDFDVCVPHTSRSILNCAADEFLVPGTPQRDAYCSTCRDCTGMKLRTNCTENTDAVCVDCNSALGLNQSNGRVWTGNNCTAACMEGWFMNHRTLECELCSYECPTGYKKPDQRQNCTHCEHCPGKPLDASYTHGCSWVCPALYEPKKVGQTQDYECQKIPGFEARQGGAEILVSNKYACEAGQRLQISSFTSAQCVSCDDVTPVEDTWKWINIGPECTWECLDTLPYKFYYNDERVDCLSWERYKQNSNPVTIRRPDGSNSWDLPVLQSAPATQARNCVWLTFLCCFIMTLCAVY